jgi:hypothetical protein
VGGLGNLLGYTVGGLGNAVGNTSPSEQPLDGAINNTLGNLLGLGSKPKPAAPVQPPAKAAPEKTASLGVTIVPANSGESKAYCRRYPDLINTNSEEISAYRLGTKLEIVCWTTPSIRTNDYYWLKTKEGCYINEDDVADDKAILAGLNPCPSAPRHWVATFQSQYKRKDCYSCPNLECKSINLGASPLVDVFCSQNGQEINGNR